MADLTHATSARRASAAARIRWQRWRLADVLRRLGELDERGELDSDARQAISRALQESMERRSE